MEQSVKNGLEQAQADGAGRRKKTIEIDGVKYLLQHPGNRWYLRLVDRCKGQNGVLLQEKYADELLENVVVSPKVGLEDISLGALNKLIQEIESFLTAA